MTAEDVERLTDWYDAECQCVFFVAESQSLCDGCLVEAVEQ